MDAPLAWNWLKRGRGRRDAVLEPGLKIGAISIDRWVELSEGCKVLAGCDQIEAGHIRLSLAQGLAFGIRLRSESDNRTTVGGSGLGWTVWRRDGVTLRGSEADKSVTDEVGAVAIDCRVECVEIGQGNTVI